jgi:hypothetical protein
MLFINSIHSFKTAHAVSKDKSLFNEKLFSAINTGIKISVCFVCVGTSWGHACYVPVPVCIYRYRYLT